MQVDSPGSEDSSSNMDESQGTDGEAEAEKGEEVKMEVGEKQSTPEGKHNDMDIDDGDDEDEDDGDDNDQEEGEVEEDGEEEEEDVEETEGGIQKKHKGENLKQSHLGDDETIEGEQQDGQEQKHKESRNKQERAKLLEKFCDENPQLSGLCAALFPKSGVSVWSGPNSLNHRQRKTLATRTNSISAAVQALMK